MSCDHFFAVYDKIMDEDDSIVAFCLAQCDRAAAACAVSHIVMQQLQWINTALLGGFNGL